MQILIRVCLYAPQDKWERYFKAGYILANRTPYRNKAVLHDEDTCSKVWKCWVCNRTSSHREFSCVPPRSVGVSGSVLEVVLTMASLPVAVAAYIYIHYHTVKRRKERRWWQSQIYSRRMEYSGRELIADMRLKEVSGHYKKQNVVDRFWEHHQIGSS